MRRYLLQVLNAQIAALAECQHESGLWHTLLDDPDSYLEASATAGFAYGILKAVRKRYVSREYERVAEKAMRGIVQNISPQGELLQTSFGTGMGSNLDFYRQIPLTSMPYGQAMAILCMTEYLRRYF
nr:Rhamnogalacturonides degradation protein RhiN [Raoultella sp. NCTC 9187]